MGVLKSIRKRNKGMSRRLNHRKMLNYSSISDGSGETVQEDIDGLNEASTPLFLQEEAAHPQVSSISLFQDPQKPFKQSKKQPKRTPVEPIGPLGVVVNEHEWDAISHISGISTHTSSTTESPPSCNLCNISSEEIQNDLDMMMQNAGGAAVDMPNVVSPGPEDKKELSALNDSRNSSKDSSRNDSSIDEGAGVKINVITNDAEILKTVDSKDGVSQDGTGSKISHVFEDDKDSTGNVVVIDNNASVASSSIYSEGLPMPTTVSPSTTPGRNEPKPSTPVFVAVSDDNYKEKQFDHHSIHRAVAPSFDGSTATVGTNNTTTNKSVCGTVVTKSGGSIETANLEANSIAEPVLESKITQKLNEIEATMRSSCASIRSATESHQSVNGPPACGSLFSSTSALSENFKDSLLHIKKELTNLYESSGLASASSSVSVSLKEPLSAVKGCSEPNLDEHMDESYDDSKEVSFSTAGSDTEYKDSSFSTAGSGTEYTIKTENTSQPEFANILTLSTVSEEDSNENLQKSVGDVDVDVDVSRSPTQASF